MIITGYTNIIIFHVNIKPKVLLSFKTEQIYVAWLCSLLRKNRYILLLYIYVFSFIYKFFVKCLETNNFCHLFFVVWWRHKEEQDKLTIQLCATHKHSEKALGACQKLPRGQVFLIIIQLRLFEYTQYISAINQQTYTPAMVIYEIPYRLHYISAAVLNKAVGNTKTADEIFPW